MPMITFRATDAEKSLWVQAAGGARELSAWIRDRCNAGLVEREDAHLTRDAPSASPAASRSTSPPRRFFSEPSDLARREVTPDPRPPSSKKPKR